MAQSFGEREKELINEQLIKKGKELFIRFGLRKTSIDELTSAVGIAKGSFYSFFKSKEYLFMEIKEREERILKEELVEKSFPNGEINRDRMKYFLTQMFNVLDEHPILSQLLNEGEMEYFMRKISPEKLQEHEAEDVAFLEELIDSWQESGAVRNDYDRDVILNLIRSLVSISLMKDRMHIQRYPEMIDLLTEMLADGLTTGGKK